MSNKNWTESELKSFIRDIVKQEFVDVKKDISDLKLKQKKLTDEEQVKEIVRQTIVNMYKFFWQKSSNYIKQI